MASPRPSAQSTPRSRAHLPAIKVITPDQDGRQLPHDSPWPSDGSGAGARKKLRLTNEQSTLLEDTFRAHNILSNLCIPILSPFHGFHSISKLDRVQVEILIHAYIRISQ
jgi:hypothetical protein